MESERHEGNYRAVIDGATPKMNRSAEGGARSSLHYGDEGALIIHRTKVFADGTVRKNNT